MSAHSRTYPVIEQLQLLAVVSASWVHVILIEAGVISAVAITGAVAFTGTLGEVNLKLVDQPPMPASLAALTYTSKVDPALSCALSDVMPIVMKVDR